MIEVGVVSVGLSAKEKKSIYDMVYRQIYHEEILKKQKVYAANHIKEIKEQRIRYRDTHPDANKIRCARYYAEHREEASLWGIQYRAMHREEHRARVRAYQDAHPEKHRKNCAKYWATHSHQCRSAAVKWFTEHPGMSNIYTNKRRALKSNAPVNDFTEPQWREIKSAHQHTCGYCGKPCKGLTQDHMIPLSRGGSHTADNIMPACLSCNSEKGTKTVQEWFNVVTGGW